MASLIDIVGMPNLTSLSQQSRESQLNGEYLELPAAHNPYIEMHE